MVQLLLLDDHTLFRESLSRLLDSEPDFTMVAQCATVAEALGVLRTHEVDVVLVDFDLGEERGTALLTAARQEGFRSRVLMVTAGMSEQDLANALRGQVSGVFLKHNSPAQLAQAIRHVMAGEIWLDSRSVQALAQAALQPPEASTGPLFTDRERQVLRGVFEGLPNKDIAGRMGVSESSVKATLQQLFEKTGVRSRSQLVRIALEHYQGLW